MNNLKLAFRRLRSDRLFSAINIAGLSVSLAVCLLITLFIREEVSYDDFHTKAGRIALFRQFEGSAGSGSGFGNLLQSNIAQIEQATRLLPAKPVITNKLNNQSAYENGFYFADSNFFQVFDLKLLEQAGATPLANPSGILISEKTAQKYFPNGAALGQTLAYNNTEAFTVAGVFENLPANSHITIELLAPFAKAPALLNQPLDGYWDGLSLTYVLASADTPIKSLNTQLSAAIKKTADPNAGIWKPAFIPLRDIHLRSNLDARVKANNAITEVYVFSAIALLVLLLACFNYINLTSARAVFKAKEIGIRKIVGAGKRQILIQYLQESGVYVFLSAVGGLLLATLAIPYFNNIAGTWLHLQQLYTPSFIGVYFGVMLLLSLLTGLLPAFTLASLQPLKTVQQKFSNHRPKFVLRKALVTIQFVVSVAIIIAVITVARQLHFIQNRALGYNRTQVALFNLPADAAPNAKQDFRNRLKTLPNIQAAALSSTFPGQGAGNNKLVTSFVPAGKDVSYSSIAVDANFLQLYEIGLLQGANFSPTSKAANNEFIINQTMADYLELKGDAVGKPLGYYTYQYTPDGGYKEVPVIGKIIGVVADYHQSDLRNRITPLLLQLNSGWEGALSVKLSSGNIPTQIAAIEQAWKQTFRDKPFEYDFLDNAFNQTYKRDRTTATALGIFAGLAILISCLGLVGLTAITVQRRTKEIGIRKVLGASVPSITRLVTQEFMMLVGIAFLIASPIAWWATNKWLQDFEYRVQIEWWMFALAAVIAALVALFTISFQAIRAAVANPVKSLRTE